MEDYLAIFVLPLIGGLIWYAVTNSAVSSPGRLLNKKFVSLGNLDGKTLNQIEATVGRANSVSALGNGQILRQWMATGYHIALLFDENDICLGISSETSV